MLCFFLFFGAPSLAAPVTITDDSGATVTLDAPAQRIIPLYSALGETLVAMGQGHLIVGRTLADESLPGAIIPTVGTHMRPNLELIAAQKPDLVIQMEGREEAALIAESLKRLGIPVARFRVTDFTGLFSCAERLGILTGQPEGTARFIAAQKARLAAASQKTTALGRKPAIFFEVRYPNLLGAGAGSMVSAVITAAGGQNALAAYPDKMVRLSEETLLALSPDLYIMQIGPMNKAPLPPADRPGFRSLRAVTGANVHSVDEDLFSRPGPRSVEAVEILTDIILQWNAKSLTSSAIPLPKP